MRRREFISAFGGAAVAWPLAAGAQQIERTRRIGVLMGWDEADTGAKANFAKFKEGLTELGWIDGRNVRMDVRWAAGNLDRMRTLAKELVGLGPDIILGSTTPVTAALQRETRTIPIVFVIVSDPVGAGFVASLSHPGANITGFINVEAAMAGKWLELLMEIAPSVKHVAIMFNPDTAPGAGSYFLPSFDAVARSHNVETMVAPVHSDAEIDMAITALEREPGGGLIVMTDGFMFIHHARVISASAKAKVPVVSDRTIPTEDGGLLSYGPDTGDILHSAASYADRVLRGAQPADLPVQVPTKFEMRLNVKTAKALGLTVPPSILARADEVIE